MENNIIGPDRRRKRRTTNAPSPSRTLTLVLSACLVLSLLLTISIEEEEEDASSSRRRFDGDSPSSHRAADDVQWNRRLLGKDGGGDVENSWKKQLRERRRRQRQLSRATHTTQRTDGSSRGMAEAAAEEDDADLGRVGGGSGTRRMAIIPRYADKHHFEECVGKTIEQCQVLVDKYVKDHPLQFDGRSTLWLDVRKIRELTDDSYYKVVLRTDIQGTRVMGLFDDGMVYYPWKWRVNGADVAVGPWNCKEAGIFLSPSDCCSKIQNDVTQMDDAGHYLACFVEEPVGGPNNPERDDRAIVVTDSSGRVARAPVAH